MKKEAVLLSLFILALILKYLHVPGSNLFLVLALITTAMIYCFFGFYLFSDKNLEHQNLLFSILAGIFLSFSIIGILFKSMCWIDEYNFSFTGLSITSILFAISIVLRFFSSDHLLEYHKKMLLRTGIFTAISFILYFTPATTLIKIDHWNDPELGRLRALQYIHPDDSLIMKQIQEYKTKKDSLDSLPKLH